MSREWYIRTDKRKLDTPAPVADIPPQNRIKTVAIVLAVVALTAILLYTTVPLLFPKDTADYKVTLVTLQTADTQTVQNIQSLFAAAADDRNQDGEIAVDVRALAVGDGTANPTLQRELLISSFVSDDYFLFVMERQAYVRYVHPYLADEQNTFCVIKNNLTMIEKDGFLYMVRARDHADAVAHTALLSKIVEKF